MNGGVTSAVSVQDLKKEVRLLRTICGARIKDGFTGNVFGTELAFSVSGIVSEIWAYYIGFGMWIIRMK